VNKNLYNKKIELPEDVIVYLKQCHDSAIGADENTEGFRRNQELRNSGYVTYQQLKRMKNFFDNFTGQQDELPFILNGGDYIKGWVNNTLNSWRDNDKRGKEIRSVVQPNQFIQPHKKDNLSNLNRPSKSHTTALGYFDLEVTESLKRINELIKKII
jgi:hypothetical protein